MELSQFPTAPIPQKKPQFLSSPKPPTVSPVSTTNPFLHPLPVSLVAQMVKNLPAMRETWVQSPGQEDPLEKEIATHSSIFAWRIPWIERSLAGYRPWSHKESDTTDRLTSVSLFRKSLHPSLSYTEDAFTCTLPDE